MPEEDEDEKYVEWELIWAKAAAKGDWWPCQKCEVRRALKPRGLGVLIHERGESVKERTCSEGVAPLPPNICVTLK